jgi:hypothetical protein
MMPKYENKYEKYWAEEEDLLRERGIDPMSVMQVEPPKLPTHRGTATLHKKGGIVDKKAAKLKYKKGGMVKGQTRDYCK